MELFSFEKSEFNKGVELFDENIAKQQYWVGDAHSVPAPQEQKT